jgi:sulfite exporter TauE/SafE
VEYDADRVDVAAIRLAINDAGYAARGELGSRGSREAGGGEAGMLLALGIGLALGAAYLIASASGALGFLPNLDARVGYATLFAIGLLTSIHCVAMCGGLALSQSVGLASGVVAARDVSSGSASVSRFSEARNSVPGRLRRLLPALLYNAGRVVSYTAIGAAVGALGGTFNFSPLAKGAIAAVAGVFMVALGLRSLGVIRALPSLGRIVPPRLRAALSATTARLRTGGPFAVGILNGLMPCGPLQAMQLYALGSGSAAAGALSMFLFSAGTVPLMLTFGLTATLLPRKFVPVMVRASAILVLFLGAVTFVRAATLAGVALPSAPFSAPAVSALTSITPTVGVSDSAGDTGTPAVSPVSAGNGAPKRGVIAATVQGGKQTVLTEFVGGRYVPIAVQVGLPLTWTIRIAADDLTGCNNELVIPAYDIRTPLAPGDNVIEFTPTRAGRIAYSCWMGMIRSSIVVADSLDQ